VSRSNRHLARWGLRTCQVNGRPRIVRRYALSMKGNIPASYYLTDADQERQVVWCLTRSNISPGSFVFQGQSLPRRNNEWNRLRWTLTVRFSSHLIDGGEVCVWLRKIRNRSGSSN